MESRDLSVLFVLLFVIAVTPIGASLIDFSPQGNPAVGEKPDEGASDRKLETTGKGGVRAAPNFRKDTGNGSGSTSGGGGSTDGVGTVGSGLKGGGSGGDNGAVPDGDGLNRDGASSSQEAGGPKSGRSGDSGSKGQDGSGFDGDSGVGMDTVSDLGPVDRVYFRERSYSRYTGMGWRSSTELVDVPEKDTSNLGFVLTSGTSLSKGGYVPAPWRPTKTNGVPAGKRNGGIVLNGGIDRGRSFSVESKVPDWTEAKLEKKGYNYRSEIEREYTALPDSVPERVYGLSDDVTHDKDTPYEEAIAIERLLQSTKEYSLNIEKPGGDYVDSFLFEMDRGYCQWFASAMTVMLRTQDIPARYTIGYAPSSGDRGKLYGGNSHAWVEVYFKDVGWVKFDPTPADRRIDRRLGNEGEISNGGEEGGLVLLATSDDREDGNDGYSSVSSEVGFEGELIPGSRVTLKASRNGEPVKNAAVFLNGEKKGVTDTDGELEVKVPYVDKLEVDIARRNGGSDGSQDGSTSGKGPDDGSDGDGSGSGGSGDSGSGDSGGYGSGSGGSGDSGSDGSGMGGSDGNSDSSGNRSGDTGSGLSGSGARGNSGGDSVNKGESGSGISGGISGQSGSSSSSGDTGGDVGGVSSAKPRFSGSGTPYAPDRLRLSGKLPSTAKGETPVENYVYSYELVRGSTVSRESWNAPGRKNLEVSGRADGYSGNTRGESRLKLLTYNGNQGGDGNQYAPTNVKGVDEYDLPTDINIDVNDRSTEKIQLEADIRGVPVRNADVYLGGRRVTKTGDNGNATVSISNVSGPTAKLRVDRGAASGSKEVPVPDRNSGPSSLMAVFGIFLACAVGFLGYRRNLHGKILGYIEELRDQGVLDYIKTLPERIKSRLSGLADWVSAPFSAVKQWILGLYSFLFDVFTDSLTRFMGWLNSITMNGKNRDGGPEVFENGVGGKPGSVDEERPDPDSVYEAWVGMVERLSRYDDSWTTADIERQALKDGFPEEDVSELTREFRKIKYGGFTEVKPGSAKQIEEYVESEKPRERRDISRFKG
ncbi:MAG: transglutaminase family protein [Halobacteria archaeon]